MKTLGFRLGLSKTTKVKRKTTTNKKTTIKRWDKETESDQNMATFFGLSQQVKLNIGGKKYITTIGTLTQREPESMLAAMFSGRHTVAFDSGIVFIDRDGKHFRQILNWLRDGVISRLPNSDYQELLREAEYYQLIGLIEHIKCTQAEEVKVKLDQSKLVEGIKSSKFTWVIENFSKLEAKKHYSNTFISCGGCKWRILVFPKGNEVDNLSIYLDVADLETLPHGWQKFVVFSLVVVSENHMRKKDTDCHFKKDGNSDWGFANFMPLSELHDLTKGYLANDRCIIEALVTPYDFTQV